MSLEGLLKELDNTRKKEQDNMIALLKEQHDALIRAKDEEIASLREEIETLRCWLDHSALPAHNPISKRKDSMGLIKLNFGKDKPCPEMWAPGEKGMLDSIPRRNAESDWGEVPILENPEEEPPVPEEPTASPKKAVARKRKTRKRNAK